jgi:hypothetical protein
MASSSLLKPGEKGEIIAKVDIKGRAGPLHKSIKVISNDPKRHMVTLFLKAMIKTEKQNE